MVQFRGNRARNFKLILKLLARLLPELYSPQSYCYYLSNYIYDSHKFPSLCYHYHHQQNIKFKGQKAIIESFILLQLLTFWKLFTISL